METRGITFRRLREMCQKRAYFYRTTESTKPIYYCISILYKYNGEKDIGCIAANCPVWARLTPQPPTRKKIRCINAVDSGSCAKNDAVEKDCHSE